VAKEGSVYTEEDFDGYPHTVPVSFIMDGDDVIITTVRNTRKVHYIRRNPKGAVTIGGESSEGAGYLLKGEFSLEEDPGLEWLRKTTNHYGGGERAERVFAEFAQKDMIIMRFRAHKVIKVL
jgi:general stress protein 26